MASELFLANTPAGFDYNEETFRYNLVSETSAHGASASRLEVQMPSRPGRVVAVGIGAFPAVSASGFVSGTVTATIRINSAAVCSTDPAVNMAASAGDAGFKSTFKGQGVSGVVNPQSAAFAAGDPITVDYNARSVGSAAAGAAGSGLYVTVRVRYDVQ